MLIAALALAALALAGCVPAPTMGTGAFRDAARATQTLVRGVSTKDDVEHLLGVPNGEGAALFWNQPSPDDIWYYEDDRTSGGELRLDGVHAQVRQQILIVFFKGNRFDGYVWSDNSVAAGAR